MLLARARQFQPSRLALVGRCAWRYLKETENPPELSLPPDLRTLSGRAVHDVIGSVARVDTDVRTALVDRIGAMLDAIDAPVPRWARRQGLPARRSVAPSVLAEWVRFAALLEGSVQRGTYTRTRSTPALFGREILLENKQHDLAGRADRVDDTPTTTVVTEYKTGRPRLAIGDDHRIQLLAYGLLAATRDERPVELVARSPGEHRAMPFDSAARAEIEAVLGVARERLPRGIGYTPQALATPGNVCLGCRFRLTCPAYPEWAERHWRDPTIKTPLDIWGELRRVDARDGLAALVIVTPNGVLNRVNGVPIEVGDTLEVGSSVRLFNLVTTERVGSHRPVNFSVVNTFDPVRSAWSAWFDGLVP